MCFILGRGATSIAIKYHDSMIVVAMYIFHIQTGQFGVCCLVGPRQSLQECTTIKDIHHIIYTLIHYTQWYFLHHDCLETGFVRHTHLETAIKQSCGVR